MIVELVIRLTYKMIVTNISFSIINLINSNFKYLQHYLLIIFSVATFFLYFLTIF